MMRKNNKILPFKIPEGSVLGINYSGMHDTAIAIVSPDGTPTFAISLERISRVKQDGRPPSDLLKGLPWECIAKVAISVECEYIVPDVLTSKFHPNLLEKPLEYDCSHAPEFLQSFDFIPVEKVFVPHHLCHASSAFWLSGFPDSTCMVYDGGMSNEEWFGGVFNATQKNGITPIDMFSCHNYANITRIYTAITAILGFTPLRHEGKITGLAAYGTSSSSCREIINEWFLHPEKLDGLVGWTNMYSSMEIPCLQADPLMVRRLRDELKKYSREDIAAAVQGIAEEHIINLLTKIISSNGGSRNLSLSGGLFANVKINQKASEIGFNKLFVSPPMSDDGTALGAALQVASENPTFSSKSVQSMFLGSSYSKREVNQLVNENEIHFTAPKNLAEEVAQLLADGLIVAIYQGAMEFGPRALGNRTILANADDFSINMSLNKKLGRTEFMPFAPVCLEEDANRLFQDMDCVKHTAEFMTVTRNCLEDMKTLCPAVVHCDGTARPQLITEQSNALVYKILTHYKRISGKPALVNTSFNVHEEPIICSPNDAIKGFFEAGLDVLILDGKVIELVKNRGVESKYLREKLWGKESRLKECATSKIKDKIQIEQLQIFLATSNNQQTAIEFSLQQVEQQRQSLQSQCETLQAEASQYEQVLQQKEAAIIGLSSELATAKQEVESLNQSNHQWWTLADQHSKSLIEAEAKIDELNQSSHHWWLEAERLSKELDTVYHSKSWIITWPLRKLSQFVQWLFYLPIKIILWLIRLPKRIVRWMLVKAMAFAVKHPDLRKLISFRLKKLGRVDGKLRELALARGLLPNPMFSQKDQPIPEVDILNIQKEQLYTLEIEMDQQRTSIDTVLDQNTRFTLFYVEHTAMFDRVTGVQRVCHKLSSSLANNIDETVILVKLDMASLEICPLSPEELKRFVSFSNFKINSDEAHYYEPGLFKTIISLLKNHPRKHWLIIPEVTYHSVHSPQPTSRLIKQARDYGLKVGVIEYDMIPLITEDASSNAQKHMNYISDISLADVIWPISHYASKGLVDYLLYDEKLSVHQMPIVLANPLPEEKDGARVMPTMDKGDRNILSLGTIDERKNQIRLIKAFNQYCESNPNTEWKLQLVGLIRDDYKSIIEKECSKNSNIEFYYSANDEDIEGFFQKSAFTVFPSLEEGYGLPIVESLWHMRPCICANFGSMKELSMKGGCLTVDVRHVSELATAISEMIHNEDLYKEKINEILERGVKTWHEYAELILTDMDQYQYGNRCKGLIYYWVDATLAASGNTGIQRVSRQIAKQLIQQGHRLVPLKWNDSLNSIVLASTEDLEYLEKWNGPDRNGWYQHLDLENECEDATYFMVDLPLNRSLDIQQRVIDTFKLKHIKCAAIFYDAIPYKLADIYPVDFTNAHKRYMTMLDQMDSVFSISETSNSDLLSFLNQTSVRGLLLEQRLKTVVLPSEFPEREHSTPSVRNHEDVCSILSVGTVEPRKNHIGLLQAFLVAEKKSQRKLKLILVGGGDTFDLELSGKVKVLAKQSENIFWVNNADDKDLKQHYHEADFTIFPSVEEGFGLPIVESLWFGCPCICANFGQMMELAASGGCAPVDVKDIDKFSEKILLLANNKVFYQELKSQISRRYFRTWDNYTGEISSLLQCLHRIRKSEYKVRKRSANFNLPQRPLLSVCITTYKRADWLDLNIENFIKIAKHLGHQVELVVCDNASPDLVADIFSKYQGHKQISVYHNTGNIGMLGNLPQTVSLARGEYIWLIGDDDIIHKGSLEKVIDIIQSKEPDLINMNYAHTNDLKPPEKEMLKQYLKTATVICSGSTSHKGTVKEVSSYNENFYTAIYSFVAKRNFAWRIYSQDTSGQPFSSLQTCVPTTKYILSNMMEAQAYWESEPLITVNLNVSWGQYAPLWILERIPEVYDLAELNGISMKEVDKWRKHTLQSALTFLDIIYTSKTPELYSQFNIIRFIRRNRHLSEFGDFFPQLEAVYVNAFEQKSPLATIPPEQLRESYYG